MSTSGAAPWRWFIAAFVLAIALGLIVGLASSMSREGSLGALLVTAVGGVVLMVAGGWMCAMYWRRLDEAAREAHKWSWFWGGSAALIPILIGFFVLVERPDLGAPLWPGIDPTPSGYVATGITIVIFTLLTGYGLAWLCWWFWKSR